MRSAGDVQVARVAEEEVVVAVLAGVDVVEEVGTEVPAEVAVVVEVVVSMAAERSAMRKISCQREPRVTRLQLVEPRDKPLGTANDRPVRPLLYRQLVLPASDSAPRPGPGLDPLLLRYLPLEVCEGSEERHLPRS